MLNLINLLFWNICEVSRIDSLLYFNNIYQENNIKLLVLIEPMSKIDQKYIHLSHPAIVNCEDISQTWKRLLEVRNMVEDRIRWCLG